MAPKLRFSRGLKAKAPGAVTAVCSRCDAASQTFYRPSISTEHKKQRWWRWGIFFFTFEGLSSLWLLFHQRFDAALPLWSSPDSWLAMFHSRRCSYSRTDDPSTKMCARCEFEHRRFHSQLRAVWSFSFSPGVHVTSFLSQPISTVIPVALTFNKTKRAVSSIAVVTKAINRTARTSLWEHPKRCFPPFGQNWAKHRRTVFYVVNRFTEFKKIVRVPGREFRFLAPPARQHLFLNLNQLVLGRRIRICLLSFRQSCECCQTNGFASPVLRDRVSMATKVTCEASDTKVCSFCPHFRSFCSIVINFSNIFFCSTIIEVRVLNRE